MNKRLGSGDERLLPILAGFDPSASDANIGGSLGGGFSASPVLEAIARVAQNIISGGSASGGGGGGSGGGTGEVDIGVIS